MENKRETAKLFRIDGIYGRADYTEWSGRDDNSIYYEMEEKDVETCETIDHSWDNAGLPSDFTKDDYFRIALLDTLRDIAKGLNRDGYVNIKNADIKINSEQINELTKTLILLHGGQTK